MEEIRRGSSELSTPAGPRGAWLLQEVLVVIREPHSGYHQICHPDDDTQPGVRPVGLLVRWWCSVTPVRLDNDSL